MSTYYYRDGQLYTTKTMCNLKETWQHECRIYPDEMQDATTRGKAWVAAERAYADAVTAAFLNREPIQWS